MPPFFPSLPYRRSLLPAVVVFSLVFVWLVGSSWTRVGFAQGPPASFRNFEAPQIHPLALTPDGTRLLAVNTPNATLSVFQLGSGSPVLTAEIPVGLEPVSVAARNNREAWVVNWLSDSVSILDLTTGNVVRTIDVGASSAGDLPVGWDGRDDKGNVVPPGKYTFQPTAYDAAGKAVAINLNTEGTVTGVAFQGGVPLLRIGTELVKMSDVTSINERNTP